MFFDVQEMIRRNHQKDSLKNKPQNYTFTQKLFCGDCNHRLSILKPRSKNGKSYVVCNYYRRTSKLNLCTPHYFNYDEIERLILEKIKELFLSIDKDKVINKTKKELEKEINKIDYITELNIIKNQIDNKNKQLDKMYLDKIDNKIAEDMYNRISIKIKNELDKLKEEKNISPLRHGRAAAEQKR